MGSSGKCRECGTAIPAESPGGFCAQCLLRLGLEADCEPDLGRVDPKPGEERAGELKQPVSQQTHNRARASVPLTEKPGDRIGRYRLHDEIGHGGCGVVYMAEQEEPVHRKVALKVIKLGMDTRQVVARFEAERQALAMMDHPNIARVLDAGTTDTGRPYFVMELVGGIKITDYCTQNHLTTRQRLDLFIQVCRAIQHAHQKGIIHRDIKPSNVLVSMQDGVPVPKVIDFGIAKATQGRLTDQTVFTAFEQFLGTPAYMSPEQAQLGGLDVDTRSDIYSLGVLLYELLTGKTPFDSKELLAAGLEAMRRTIQEKEPPTPSTKLEQTLASLKADGGNQKIEEARSLETKHLVKLLRGDVDWIVMKCLEKDRARRYETANGLAMDIERHLNSEPLVASPPSRLYRLQKLVRRNRVTATATAAVVLALVLGVIVSAWQAWRATHAERRSMREAAKSEQVAELLKDMLKGAGPSKALGRDTTMLREILSNTVERISKQLTNQPEVQIELRSTVAATYFELGLYSEMKVLAETNLALARSRLGAEHLAVAMSLDQISLALCELGSFDEAETIERQALAIRQKLLGKEHLLVADSLENLARVITRQSVWAKVERFPEAEALNREALAMRQKLLGNEHPDVAASLNNLALVLQDEGKLDEAEKVQRKALLLQQKLFGEEHPDVATSLQNLASVLFARGKLDEAEAMHKKVVALRRKLMGNNHPVLANSLHDLALVLLQEGKLDEAEDLEREALAIHRRALGNHHPDLIGVLDNLARVLHVAGKNAEAEVLEREALSIHRKTPGKIDGTLANLALILRLQGKLEESESLLQESLVWRRERGQTNELESTLAQLTDVLLAEQKFQQAEPVARECLALREKLFPNYWRTFNAKRMLGEALLGEQKFAEAEPILLGAYEGLKHRAAQMPLANWAQIKQAAEDLIRLYEATERVDKVAEWRTELTQCWTAFLAPHRNAAESGNPGALNDLAWFLATCEDATLRNGPAAVAYAEKAVVATNRKDPGSLDTLAAAYAESGQFSNAVRVQEEALTVAKSDSIKRDLQSRLKLYQSNTAYHER